MTGWIGGESHVTVNDLIPEGIQVLTSTKQFSVHMHFMAFQSTKT